MYGIISAGVSAGTGVELSFKIPSAFMYTK